MAVYLVMVTVPAVVGCVLGTVARQPRRAAAAGRRVRESSARATSASTLWVDVARAGRDAGPWSPWPRWCPALRARRLPAAEAISAGSAPQAGRGAAGAAVAQRDPAAALGQPRPRHAVRPPGAQRADPGRRRPRRHDRDARDRRDDVGDRLPGRGATRPPPTGSRCWRAGSLAAPCPPTVRERDPRRPCRRRGRGAAALAARRGARGGRGARAGPHRRAGTSWRSRSSSTAATPRDLGPQVLTGHWPDGAGEVAVPSRFLNQRGLALGDTITVDAGRATRPGARSSG